MGKHINNMMIEVRSILVSPSSFSMENEGIRNKTPIQPLIFKGNRKETTLPYRL